MVNTAAAWGLLLAATLTGCATSTTEPEPTSAPSLTAPTTTQPSPASAAATPPAPRNATWVELTVGECVAAVPAVDLGEVMVTMVDCAAPHQAEVYLLAPIPVNTALTDVADQQCRAGLPSYAADPARYTVTFLIDSRQDRTSNNPLPSTVICLLQAADGQPLTGSARR